MTTARPPRPAWDHSSRRPRSRRARRAGGSGAIAAKLIDTGIPDRVVGELRELTQPGQTVLALLVSDIAGMAVIEELRRFRGAHVVYAQLPQQALDVMREAMGDRQ